MKWILTCIFFFCLVYSRAQPPGLSHSDSLERKMAALKPGPKREKIRKQLFFVYLNSDAKRALALANTGLAEAEQLKNDSTICFFEDCIGEAYLYLEDLPKALDYLNRDYTLAQKIGYKQQMALALSDMSGIYQNESDYVTAQSCSFKALSIYEQLNDYRMMAVCNVNIGVSYNNNANYKKAVYYGLQALQIAKKMPNSDVVPTADVLVGNSYASLGNIKAANNYYEQALELYRANKNDYGVAVIYSRLSADSPGDFKKQIELRLNAQRLWDKIAPDNFYSINNMGDLGCTYGQMAMHTKDAAARVRLLKQSQAYLERAVEVAKKTNTKSSVIDYSDSLSTVNAALGNYTAAYANLKLSNRLYDSVYSQDNKNKIASLEGKHEIELRDKQLLINKLQIANQQKQGWFLTGGIVTLLIIAGLIYGQSRQRQKTNTVLVALNAELDEANKVKTRFFSIVNHDLRSPIASFINFLHLQQEAPDLIDETSRQAYSQKATASAEGLLNTMEDLLLWSKGQMENFKPHIKRLMVSDLYNYIRASTPPERNIQIVFKQQPGMELESDEHYVKTIMHNLTKNAIKALGSLPDGIIEWDAWEDRGLKFLSIKDNGPGATEQDFNALYDESAPVGIKTGLGLHIVRDLAKAINCSIKVYAEAGSGVEIRLSFKS